MALANPSATSVTVTLILRDAGGDEIARRDEIFEPGQHQALFVDQLFPESGEFTGSMTFQTLSSEQGVAAVTLRQSTNLQNEVIFSTLPVVDLSAAATTESIIFPQVGAGTGLSTQLVLINGSDQEVSGQIQLFDSSGVPLELSLDEVAGTTFSYQIEGDGIFRGELTKSTGLSVGYAVVTLGQGSRTPAGSAIFQFTSGEAVVSEAGVLAVQATTAARIFVDNVQTQTGVALASVANPATTVTFRLIHISGTLLQTTTREVAAGGHLAIFADQLFSQVGEGFIGLMEITSPVAIAPVTLKLTTNARNQSILTTLPIVDLTRPETSQSLVFPQIGFGTSGPEVLATRLILINRDAGSPITGDLSFFQSDGTALVVPLGQQMASELDYQINAGGGAEFRPGLITGEVVSLVIDPSNPTASEVVVAEDTVRQLSPLVLDGNGLTVAGADFNYSSQDPLVATVDDSGLIQANQEGFSTLTVSVGAVVRTVTITVSEVTSGKQGFATGIVQDLAGRFYFANTEDHTISQVENLQSTPELYAGTPQTPGLENDQRLNSLFDSPGRLALTNQTQGILYVSDQANHVIRLVELMPGRVKTLAGRGSVGAQDGDPDLAGFNNPQGIALDNRGNLWVADSGNHTIRRVDVFSGRVETIAGEAGNPGFANGVGDAARFNSPLGIALEVETRSQRIERQRTNAPPPPVSMIVTDTGNGMLRRVKETGEVETIGSPSQGPGGAGGAQFAVNPLVFDAPTDVAVDPFGNIYVTEPDTGLVRVVLPNLEVVLAAPPDTFSSPNGIVISGSGSLVVADSDIIGREITYGAPEISGLTPEAIGTEGGIEVTIRGRNFAPDSLVVVAGVVIEDIEVLNTQTIVFDAPPLPSGLTTLTVQNRGGLVQSSLFVEPFPFDDLLVSDITTIAGGTTFVGDGAEATQAFLGTPTGLALDEAGNLFIADGDNNRIRRVDATTGIVSTVAGTGVFAFSGDGRLAIASPLAFPCGLAVGRAGNIFISDRANNRIRKVDATTGTITTVAGTGERGFSGDGGPATEATLLDPTAVFVDDAGNLFITDRINDRIRKVDATTGINTTVAGSGVRGFSGDGGLATNAALNLPEVAIVDGTGNILIADTFNSRGRRVDATTGIITTVAGTGEALVSGDGGPATSTPVAFPSGVALDGNDNILILEAGTDRIRKVDVTTGIITTLAGTSERGFSGDGGPATEATLSSPLVGLVSDGAGNILVADTFNNRIRRVDAMTGIITTVAGSGEPSFLGDGGPATKAALLGPAGVVADAADNLYVADTVNSRVRRVDAVTGIVTTVAGTGSRSFSGDGGPASEAGLSIPTGVAVDRAGDLFIADSGNNRIRKVEVATGDIETVAGSGATGFGAGSFSGDGGLATDARLFFPEGVAVDGIGNLFIADSGNSRIRKVDAATGVITTVAGGGVMGDGGPATDALLFFPEGVAVDKSGNLFITDTGNNRVRKVNVTNGIITTVAVLNSPTGVAVDEAGNLFIADTGSNQIRKADPVTGIITTVAGTGSVGFTGDGGPAADAAVPGPGEVAIDGAGNLLIADEVNQRIRVVRGPIAEVAAPPGAISGRVVDAGTGLGIPSGLVQFWDLDRNFVTSTLTEGEGNFASYALPTGTYFATTSVELSAFNPKGSLYVDELFNNIPCAGGGEAGCDPTTGTPLLITAGVDRPGIDFALDLGGMIAGTIIDAGTDAPLEGISVEIWNANGNLVSQVLTDASGNYISSEDLTTGSYFATTRNSLGYRDQVYDDVLCSGGGGVGCDPTTGTPIAVTLNGTTSGIDFVLALPMADPAEPNNSFTNATTVGCGQSLFDVSILPARDVDFYAISLSSGEILSVDIDARGLGSDLDSVLGIFDTDGTTLLAQSDDDLAPGESSSLDSYLEFATPADGTYFVAVSSFSDFDFIGDGESIGSYTISFQCQVGGAISGTITDAGTGAPITNVGVELFDDNGDAKAFIVNDSQGAYTFADLPPGTFFVATFNLQGYVDEAYNNVACPGGGLIGCDPTAGSPLVATAGSILSGIDFQLDQGGTISGTVTNAATQLPVSNSLIELWDEDGDRISVTFTDESGGYTSGGLPAGTYFASTSIAFSDLNPEPYINELYDDISCLEGGGVSCDPTTGTPILVTAGNATPAIDFALDVQNADAIEPNDDAGSATVISCGNSFSNVSIIPSGDVDFYAISLLAGEILSVDIDARELGSNLDSVLGIFDTDGTTLLVQSDDDSAPGESFSTDSFLEFAVPADGVYFVAVSSYADLDFNGDGGSVGTYTIHFQCQAGPGISGTVTTVDSGLPLEGVEVQLFSQSGISIASVATDSQGAYTLADLPAGTFFAVTLNSEGYVDELYDNILCPGGGDVGCDPTAGTPIVVTAGSTTRDIDFALDLPTVGPGEPNDNFATAGPAACGDVISDVSIFPAGDVDFYAISLAAGQILSVDIDSQGSSLDSVLGLFDSDGTTLLAQSDDDSAPGESFSVDSYLQFDAPADGIYFVAVSSYADFDFNGEGDSIGSYTISFGCQAGGTVSGTVTEAGTGLPIAGVEIELFDGSGDSVTSAMTDATGAYTTGLQPGTFFAATSNSQGYVDELYDNLACPGGGNIGCDPTTGTPLPVTPGSTTQGIDFALDLPAADALEPNNNVSQATPITCGDVIMGVLIVPLGDIDYYAVSLAAGEVLSVDIDAEDQASGLDSILGIFDTDGTTLLAENDDGSAPGESFTFDSYLQFAAPADGIYFVAVASYSDYGFNGDGETLGTYAISFLCQAGGMISGTVTDDATGLAISFVEVDIFNENGDSVISAFTDSQGAYSFGLPSGTFFATTTNFLGYVDELYDNLNCLGGGALGGCDPTTGTPISVTVGSNITGIDFALDFQEPDALEPNDDFTQASTVACEDSLNVSIVPFLDVDFYGISLAAGQVLAVDIDADELGSSLDSVLGIFDVDGTTLLTSSDDDTAPDESFSTDSYLEFTAPAGGTYFVAVSSFADLDFSGGGGSLGNYTISFQCPAGPARQTGKRSAGSKVKSDSVQILKMRKEGFSSEEIARKLKLSPDQVLRRLKRSGRTVFWE